MKKNKIYKYLHKNGFGGRVAVIASIVQIKQSKQFEISRRELRYGRTEAEFMKGLYKHINWEFEKKLMRQVCLLL